MRMKKEWFLGFVAVLGLTAGIVEAQVSESVVNKGDLSNNLEFKQTTASLIDNSDKKCGVSKEILTTLGIISCNVRSEEINTSGLATKKQLLSESLNNSSGFINPKNSDLPTHLQPKISTVRTEGTNGCGVTDGFLSTLDGTQCKVLSTEKSLGSIGGYPKK